MIKNKILELLPKNKRSLKALKNTIFSFIIKGVNVLLNFALVPLLINKLSIDSYGIWLTLSSFIGLFTFFDIGLGNGLRNKLGEALAKNNNDASKSLISTGYFLITVICFLVFIFFLFVNQFIDWGIIMNTTTKVSNEISKLSIFIVFFLCLRLIFNLIYGVLNAHQIPAVISIIDTLGLTVAFIGVFLVSKLNASAGLMEYGIVLAGAPVLILLISNLVLFNTKFKNIKPDFRNFNKVHVSSLINTGTKFFFIQLTALILYQSNNFIIAHTSGNTDVAIYNVAYKYAGLTFMIFSILIAPLWSASTEAYFQKDFIWIKNIEKKLLIVLYTFIGIIIIQFFISDYFYEKWVGKNLKVPLVVTGLLLFYFALNLRAALYCNIINGTGKIKLQFYMYVLQIVVHVPLAIILGNIYGLKGVLISMCLTMVINNLWMPKQFALLISQKAKGIWNK